MYAEAKLSPTPPQQGHLEIANKMAIEITERFNPVEQNEAVKLIYQLVKERRLCDLKESEERCNFLSKTLQDLG